MFCIRSYVSVIPNIFADLHAKKPSPTRGRWHGAAVTDEVEALPSTQRSPPHQSPPATASPHRCESIVEPQEEGGESEGGEDVEEQTGAGTDMRSRLDVRFGLQPVEKDLNRLPQGTDMR